jgi:hypothetical protein
MVKQREARRTVKLLRQVSEGKITLNQARERIGLQPIPLLDEVATESNDTSSRLITSS